MTRTHRRKIARSVAIRRVKPNAKRKERKTQKRKPRNIVMKGGVHENLKVYVIQKKLGKPKCFIVQQQKSMTKDTIYLFFDSNMKSTEIKEFVCAAMGLGVDTVINPELEFASSEVNEFNNLFVKLSGNFLGYSLSSGNLYASDVNISKLQLKTHTTTPKIESKNGKAIIDSLILKTSTNDQDYTFSEFTKEPYFRNENFDLPELKSLGVSVMRETLLNLKTHCSQQTISRKIEELKKMVKRQENLIKVIETGAYNFPRGRDVVPGTTKDQHKELTLKKARTYVIDIQKAKNLIEEIKSDNSFSLCKSSIEDIFLKYIDGEKEFTPNESIPKMVDDTYLLPQ